MFSPLNKKLLSAVLFTGSIFSAASVIADATLHFTRGTGAKKETHNMIFIKDLHINLSQGANGTAQNYSIFDANGEKIIHVNPEQKAYMVMDKATINEQVSKMKKSIEMMRAQMEERLKTMPADQQKMMRKMMEAQGLGPASKEPPMPQKSHIKTGKWETIAGIGCEIVEVHTKQTKSEELCVASETKMGLNANDAKAVVAMKKFMNYMAQSARDIMPNQNTEEPFDGLPIRTRSYDPKGNLVNEIILDSISKDSVAADKIAIPDGYQLVDTPQMH